MLQMAAFIAAYLTSVSRVSDYHHRGSDVVGGIVIGVIIAVFLTKEVGRKLFWFKDKEANK
jgi:membrane-associated phospholipid phosphatase